MSANDEATLALAAVLTKVERYIRRFVVMTDHQMCLVVLWVFHTHVFAAADCTPYVNLTSASKRCGKTRLLEVLEWLIARPWLTGSASAAALRRKVHRDCPSLLMDETDATFADAERAQTLRGLIDTGYRLSGKATVCVGPSHEPVDFRTFCPKALAGIGILPDTIGDRSIPIHLERRTRSQGIDRFRYREAEEETGPIREAMAALAQGDIIDTLACARPALPTELDDRAQECVEPLLAIADMAGGEWPERARRAAVVLMGGVRDADDEAVTLLRLIREAFRVTGQHVMASTDLIRRLSDDDSGPWSDWWDRNAREPGPAKSAARDLRKTLRPFNVSSRNVRIGDWVGKGYKLADFAKVFATHLDGLEGAATSATYATNAWLSQAEVAHVAHVAQPAGASDDGTACHKVTPPDGDTGGTHGSDTNEER
jgi:hypothetical protein